MNIESTRFGSIECEETDIIEFASGIIGFPEEKRFILIRHGESQAIGWLQSAGDSTLAFPVVSAHGLMPEYPDVPVHRAAVAAGLEGTEEDFAVMAVLSAPQGQPATVNLLAPVVVNSSTRKGAQVFLEGSRFTTRELFMMPPMEEEQEAAGDAVPEAQAAAAP